MEIQADRLAALKLYCRIDEDDTTEDVLLSEMFHDAVSYLEDAGVREPPAGTPRRAKYDLCINAMVLDSYDNRGTAIHKTSAVADNPAFRRRLNQLKLTEPVEADGTVSDLNTGEAEG